MAQHMHHYVRDGTMAIEQCQSMERQKG